MPKHLKKLSEEIIHENPWCTYKHDTYEKPNGTQGDYYYLATQGNSIIIPVLADGRIVLVLQTRYLMQRQSIEFPCGGKMKDETAIEAAKRELYEETGCIAKEFIKIGAFQPLNGLAVDESHIFLANVVEQQPLNPDDTESIDILYRRADEIEEMIQRNDIWDGQTLASWAMARNHFFKEKPQSTSPAFESIHHIIDDLIGG